MADPGLDLKKGRLAVVSELQLMPFTFATLPESSEGTLAYITDSSTTAIGAVISGGGANEVIARYDGTNWLVFGGGTVVAGGSNKSIQYNNSNALGGIGPLTNGQLVIGSTGATSVAASLTAPAAGLTITGGAGTVTFALADDLLALEGMASTGLVARTAANTYAQRTITGTADRLTVTDGDGVSGNPTLDISTSYVGQATITTLGTITTGTWGASVSLPGTAFADLTGSPVAGMIAYITDSNNAIWGAAIAGGGANKVLGFYNGTNWTVFAI